MVQVAPNAIQEIQEIPIEIAGGTHYGRYPKISLEESWNFIVSDGWLVPYAGYKNVVPLIPTQPGRGIYASYVADIMIAVIAQTVYSITPNLTPTIVGQLTTFTGDVYIAENNGGIIAITDGANVYTWNYATTTFTTIPGGSTNFPFMNPGFISFQNHDSLSLAMALQFGRFQDSIRQFGTMTPNMLERINLKPTTYKLLCRFLVVVVTY